MTQTDNCLNKTLVSEWGLFTKVITLKVPGLVFRLPKFQEKFSVVIHRSLRWTRRRVAVKEGDVSSPLESLLIFYLTWKKDNIRNVY